MNFFKYAVILQLLYIAPLIGVYYSGLNWWTFLLGVGLPVLYFYHVTTSLLEREMENTFWIVVFISVCICGLNSIVAIDFHGHRQLDDPRTAPMIYFFAFFFGNGFAFMGWALCCGWSLLAEMYDASKEE